MIGNERIRPMTRTESDIKADLATLGMLTCKSRVVLEDELAEVRRVKYAEHAAKQRAEQEAHHKSIIEEYGTANLLDEAAVYAYAWQEGHSGGYSDVGIIYGQVAEVVRKNLSMAKKGKELNNE
jgi:hypothetical protein